MTPEQFKEILSIVEKRIDDSTETAVKKHVNGHIKELSKKVDDYIEEDIKWKAEDKRWKDNAQPSVSLGSKVITFTDAMKWILLTGASIAGFIMAIKTIDGLFK